MITQFNDFNFTQPPQIQDEFGHVKIEHLENDRRMMVFENYWGDSCFNQLNTQSCRPFLENIGLLIGEQVTVGHRYINSITDLSYLIGDSGVLWDHPETFSLSYFGIHGGHKGFELTQGLISKEEIIKMCKGFGNFPNILYFGSCSLFEDDDQFGYDLLSLGVRGVLGYKKKIPFMVSMLIDLFFISSFFLYKDGNPFDYLEELYRGVIDEFPISQELGFTLYI